MITDAKSVLNMSITVTVSTQNPLASPGHNISIKTKKLLQNHEISAGARVNAWVDSMRASSPTHTKSTSSVTDDQVTWNLHHPSALEMFEQIIDASKGKQIVMFLDYDGTLSPIVEDPDRAFMSKKMRNTVRKLAKCFPTAIVSGRCRDKVYKFVKLAELYYAGSHGLDTKGPEKRSKSKNERVCSLVKVMDGESVLFQPASEFLPMIDEVYKQLVDTTKSTPGAKVENNKFCLSVHFRCVDEKKWSELAQLVRSALTEYPKLRLTQGRKDSLTVPMFFPVYIRYDRTDEDAFKILRDRGQGFGILVSKFPKETSASYSLQEPDEVMDFLRRLVEWKQLSLQAQSRM
ncbi:Trehalose-phosphate phosphatase [Gossypium arboreum]|uniref:Trehalose 6-phosphate phosphatase n=1 Tax=Gossypium arboreum TaxID=29729 RepID=A0A0B0P1E7_GOSAR|nr:Trehalose-phosphate phosphatase [Gossypium arboreum]